MVETELQDQFDTWIMNEGNGDAAEQCDAHIKTTNDFNEDHFAVWIAHSCDDYYLTL